MESVDEFDKAVKSIIDGQEETVGKFCFTMRIRYSLSRKAVKAIEKGINLLEDGKFQKVSYRPDIQRSKSVLTRGFQDFDSRKSVFEEIMKALAGEDVYSIGVYGMGGVGKTTLVKKVAAQAKEDGLFRRAIFAEVSHNVNLENLQQQIAEELNMKLDELTVAGRAKKIRERLKKETSILIVLDNIWKKLDLDEVGIPFWNDGKGCVVGEIEPAGKGVSNLKCRLLLTSRHLHVLCNGMNMQRNFSVEILSGTEALDLFWRTVNNGINDEKEEVDFNNIAIEIIKKCAGLPVAITTLASALKDKEIHSWKDVSGRLQKSNPKFIQGMEESVFSSIELSYDFLPPEEKSLFLLCALQGTGFSSWISDLMKYSKGLNLFENVDTMEELRYRMYTLINNLKSSCLLLDGNGKGQVKMHDIIHAVALSIASSKDSLMFSISNGSGIREVLEDKLSKGSTMVNFRGEITELPEMLDFPNLKYFHLSPEKRRSLQISDNLFDNVKELRVLDFTKFELPYLPSSLGGLTNLRTLCLDQCLLGDVAIIGKLNKLEILSFLKSEVAQLPIEIGQLIRLKVLDLSNCYKLKVIAPNVLSNLTRLEELYMSNSFHQWDVDGQQNASLAELKKLCNLTTLEMQVLDAHIIPPDLFFPMLRNYKIFVGDLWKWSDKHECSRILKLQLSKSFYLSDRIKSLLKEVEELYLDEPKDVKNLFQALTEEGFQQLKHLRIQNPPERHYISNSSIGWGLCSILPHKLETLILQNLVNIEMICRDQLEVELFGQLKIMKIEKCHKLKNLILPIAGHLLQLQKIKVSECNKLEEIVFVGGTEFQNKNGGIEFTELHSVKLGWLPCLSRFGFTTLENGSNNFKSFFNQNVLLPKLEKLWLSDIDFRCCETLAVKNCLFPFPLIRSLKRLLFLMISDCEAVEAITDTEGVELPGEMIFPSLKILDLSSLPKLKRFCLDPLLEKQVSWSSLLVLGMHSISSSAIWFNKLEKLFYLHNLEALHMSDLDDLEYLFTSSMLNSLVQLEYLCVENCKLMKTVVAMEDNQLNMVKISNLNKLELHDLPKLAR